MAIFGYCWKCPKLKPYPNSSNFIRHFNTSHIVKTRNFICPLCKRDLQGRNWFESHLCEPINENLEVANYKVRDETTFVHNLMKDQTTLQMAQFCISEQYCLSNLWPPISVPTNMRKISKKYNYKNYGNPSQGMKILITALKEQCEAGDIEGLGEGLFLHRNINVYHGNENEPICQLRESVTRPNHRELQVEFHGSNEWHVTLLSPPKPRYSTPLDIQKNDHLVVFKTYAKGSKYMYHQHQYPQFKKVGLNLFTRPWMIDYLDLEHMTGLKLEAYWTLVDRLFFMGEKDRRKINLPAAVLLARLIMRQNLSIQMLTNIFALKKTQIGAIFKCISISHYSAGNYISRMWTHPETTNDILDNYFAYVDSKIDRLHHEILSKFSDPKQLNRKPFVICLDSKKFALMKSSDLQFQKRTYYDKKNQHYITLTAACTLDGTIVNFTKPSVSITPAVGDALISSFFIAEDNLLELMGEKRHTGLSRIIKGTDNYFW